MKKKSISTELYQHSVRRFRKLLAVFRFGLYAEWQYQVLFRRDLG